MLVSPEDTPFRVQILVRIYSLAIAVSHRATFVQQITEPHGQWKKSQSQWHKEEQQELPSIASRNSLIFITVVRPVLILLIRILHIGQHIQESLADLMASIADGHAGVVSGIS